MAREERPPTIPLRPIPRRAVLRGSALAAGGVIATGVLSEGAAAIGTRSEQPLGGLAQADQATPEALAAYEPQALTVDELEILKAVIDRLIPSDDLGPGAVEAGVFVFIDRALAGPDAAMLPMYQEGLAAIATTAGDGAFAELAADAQDELLTQAEEHGLTGGPGGSSACFWSTRARACLATRSGVAISTSPAGI